MNDMTEVHGTLKRSIGVDIRAHFNDPADVDNEIGGLALEVWFDVMPDWGNDAIADGAAVFVYNKKKKEEDYEKEVRQIVEARLEAARNSREIADDNPEIIFSNAQLEFFARETARVIMEAFAEWVKEEATNG